MTELKRDGIEWKGLVVPDEWPGQWAVMYSRDYGVLVRPLDMALESVRGRAGLPLGKKIGWSIVRVLRSAPEAREWAKDFRENSPGMFEDDVVNPKWKAPATFMWNTLDEKVFYCGEDGVACRGKAPRSVFAVD